MATLRYCQDRWETPPEDAEHLCDECAEETDGTLLRDGLCPVCATTEEDE